jgi:hypothetical protein
MRAAGLIGLAAAMFAAGGANAQQEAVRPGIYELRPLHANGRDCIGNALRGFGDRFYKTWSCNEVSPLLRDGQLASRSFAIVPHRFGGAVIRLASPSVLRTSPGVFADPNSPSLVGDLCMTVARGVVIGPPAINSMPCEIVGAARSRRDAGAPDQRFSFVPAGPDTYSIRTSSGDCLDVRDSGQTGAELIAFTCNGQPNQLFELVFREPFRGEIRDWLLAEGWRETPTGMAQGPAQAVQRPPVVAPAARVAGAAPVQDKKPGKQ